MSDRVPPGRSSVSDWIQDYLYITPDARRREARRAMKAAGVFPDRKRFRRSWVVARSAEGAAPERTRGPHQMTGLEGLRSEFDNRFRGTTAVIRQRLDQYVGILDLGSLGRLGTAVDLGCGRGEWLDLLADHHVPAYGVELDDDVAAGARTRGHDIRVEDALAHLREVATGSLGLVTMFHLAEHLPFGTLLEVLREAHRTLASGGVLVVETPNPTNLVVGASTFYIDPTHLRPLPPELLEFLGTAAGFEAVQVVPLNPSADPPFFPPASLAGDAAMEHLVAELNRVLLGPMDSALIATKDSLGGPDAQAGVESTDGPAVEGSSTTISGPPRVGESVQDGGAEQR